MPYAPKFVAAAVLFFLVLIAVFASAFVVPPGHRGILITMGRVRPMFAPEGFGVKMPFVTTVIPVSTRQQTRELRAECYSSDLQQVVIEVRTLYRLPESKVVRIFQDYAGDPFDALVGPRVQEAIKEITALQSAEQIVKRREEIKQKSLETARNKIGDILIIEDLVIQNIALSKELEHAIEAKMVQEQEAAKSRFTQLKAEIEAKTAVIRAQGEAEAIRIRGDALKQNQVLIQLQIVEKWDGKAPLVVSGSAGGSNIILPLGDLKSLR